MLRLSSKASRGLLLLLVFALIALVVRVPARAEGAEGALGALGGAAPTVDLRQLLAISRGALTAAAQAATGPLGPGQPAGRSLWAAFDAMGHSLDAVGTTFAARSPAYFDALSTGSRTLAELRAVWAHAGVDNAGVRSGIETLSSSYQLLRGSYGWEVLRQQQGGPLTVLEQRRLQAMQQAQAAFAARLASLRQQAARAGDAQAAADLARLAAQARSAAAAAAAQGSLAAYLAAQQSAESLQGEWAGDSRSVRPATKKAWKKADPLVEDLTTGNDVGFVFTTDLSKADAKADAWAPLESPVEVPDGVDLGSVPSRQSVPSVPATGEEALAVPLTGFGDLDDLDSIDPGEGAGAPVVAPVVTPVVAPALAFEPASVPATPILVPSPDDLLRAFALLGHLLG